MCVFVCPQIVMTWIRLRQLVYFPLHSVKAFSMVHTFYVETYYISRQVHGHEYCLLSHMKEIKEEKDWMKLLFCNLTHPWCDHVDTQAFQQIHHGAAHIEQMGFGVSLRDTSAVTGQRRKVLLLLIPSAYSGDQSDDLDDADHLGVQCHWALQQTPGRRIQQQHEGVL